MESTFELIEVGGFHAALRGMRYPTKSNHLSDTRFFDRPEDISLAAVELGSSDARLATGLISKGPVHGKFQRGMTAWFDINMPRYIWSELDTYTVGVDMVSSESTMYTLVKEIQDITPERFCSDTPLFVVEQFRDNVDRLTAQYGDRKAIPLGILKSCLPEGWMQARVRGFSYQTLASMYHYRKDHRLSEWRKVICKAIENLPYFQELILGELEGAK